ncbi:hypothetical protein [Candidatus Regiella endosymbiont of Tuberolachnus salignus]|uniref:hypothetical protein n=1 Tax=Candidatus Regiella endosymbiont of Tuberolachnus salignus TaxID=3077956 RepID=UPI0030D33C43
MNFELRLGGQGDRPMSVDILPDEANTRSQRRRNLKGEGYIPTVLEVAARRPGGETDERRQLRDSANTRSQQRGGFKGEGYIYR